MNAYIGASLFSLVDDSPKQCVLAHMRMAQGETVFSAIFGPDRFRAL